MKSPGVTVRPIQTIDGGREVNETFFDDVKVPVENLVGEENRGWDCAKFLLGNERTGIARVGYTKQRVQRIKALAGRVMAGDRPLPVPYGVVEGLSGITDARGVLNFGSQLRPGQKVRVVIGPFAERIAELSRAVDGSRVQILLDILGVQRLVWVKREALAPAV